MGILGDIIRLPIRIADTVIDAILGEEEDE